MFSLPSDIHIVERGWLSANQIFHQGEEFLDVVDSGFFSHTPQTLALVNIQLQANHSLKAGKLLNTHLHSDHCGGNAELAHKFGFQIYIPSGEWEAVTHWDQSKLSYQELGQHCPEFKANKRLDPGSTIRLGKREWAIIAAPGHAPHSIMLFEQTIGILISADALWEKGFGALFPGLVGDGDFKEARDCLDLIKQLKPKFVIPGHGKPFTDVPNALNYAYSRLDYLESDPKLNAFHVAKVLFKFKLLELQNISQDILFAWMLQTPMLTKVRSTLELNETDFFSKTIQALIKAQAIQSINNHIIDLG